MRLFQFLFLASSIASTLSANSIVFDNTHELSAGADSVSFFGPLYNSFTSTAAQRIAGLQLILSNDGTNDSSGAVDVGLYADDMSAPGGLIAILGTVSDSNLSDIPEIYGVPLTDYPLLSEDTVYWIGLSGITNAEWYYDYDSSGTGVVGEFFSNQFGTFSDIYDPYQMSVTEGASEQLAPAPEPASCLLLLGAAIFVALVRLPARRVIDRSRWRH